MKYTFQQRKYVFNRIVNALTTKTLAMNAADTGKKVERTIESQLLKSELKFVYPRRYAGQMNRAFKELEKLEEAMFLAGAPALQAAMDKLQAKIEKI